MALPEPLRASAQHIGLLHDKRRVLDDKRRRLLHALVSAELQFLTALRRETEAGETSWAQLRESYDALQRGGLRGSRTRWLDTIGITPEEVARKANAEAARHPRRVGRAGDATSRPAPRPHRPARRRAHSL